MRRLQHFKILFIVSAFVSILALIVGCADSKKSQKSTPTPIQKIYKVYGDPITLIEGAETSHEGLVQTLGRLQKVFLFNEITFSDKPESEEIEENVSQESIEEKESAPTEFEAPQAFEMKIRKDKKSNSIWLKNEDFSIEVIQNSKKIFFKFEEESYEVLHFSESKDKKILSVLIYGFNNELDSRELTALYFSTDYSPQQKPAMTKYPFSYVEGPGVITRWPKNKILKVELCDTRHKHMKASLKEAVSAWAAPLQKKLKIEYSESKKYKPFSDLNQKCVYLVEHRIEDARAEVGAFGATLSVVDYSHMRFVDSDVLIFKDEFLKGHSTFDSDSSIQDLYFVILHELGHFLGLDHNFSKNNKSIMGYNFKIERKLHRTDIEAIQALYN
jgi:hypothetical protein